MKKMLHRLTSMQLTNPNQAHQVAPRSTDATHPTQTKPDSIPPHCGGGRQTQLNSVLAKLDEMLSEMESMQSLEGYVIKLRPELKQILFGDSDTYRGLTILSDDSAKDNILIIPANQDNLGPMTKQLLAKGD